MHVTLVNNAEWSLRQSAGLSHQSGLAEQGCTDLFCRERGTIDLQDGQLIIPVIFD
jgi:hypothetical protein